MKRLFLVPVVTVLCFASACKTQSSNPHSTQAQTKATPSSAAEPKLSEARPPTFKPDSQPDTSEPVKFPFPDFPKVATTAKPGDYVLAPSYNWIKDAADKGVGTTSFIWYVQKMAASDKDNSELQFLNERHKVPNPYIIEIPPKQTARKGDIILTWWQSGSGMQRAIVVDDADPARPIVRYLDIAYDNPARSHDGSTTIGKMDERLISDSFLKLKSWDPGTRVAIQVGANQKVGTIIRSAGNQVLVLESNNRLAVYPRGSCTALPLTPNVSVGARVMAPRYGQSFAGATVSAIDARNGRVVLRFDGDAKDQVVAFGDVQRD